MPKGNNMIGTMSEILLSETIGQRYPGARFDGDDYDGVQRSVVLLFLY